jgi:hypothetical protein
MKKLIFLLIMIIPLLGISQTKYLVQNGEIVATVLPYTYSRPTGETVFGYNKLPEAELYADGWRNGSVPTYDPATQRLGQRYYNEAMDAVTWVVIDKTPEELAAEREAEIQAKEDEIDVMAVKRLLQKTVETSLNYDSLTTQQIADLTTIYPQYRPGKSYIAGEVFALDSLLFRVIQAHTSQADWIPTEVPALYKKFTPPGQIAEWVQPTGSHDAYNIGDKVSFNGQNYESLINGNVWSPAAYPAGWKKL